MSRTSADEKTVNSLEVYAAYLGKEILMLKDLHNTQVGAYKAGILKEDQIERLNVIIHDIKNRLMKLYFDQLKSVCELLPKEYNFKSLIEKLKQEEIERFEKGIEKIKNEKDLPKIKKTRAKK